MHHAVGQRRKPEGSIHVAGANAGRQGRQSIVKEMERLAQGMCPSNMGATCREIEKKVLALVSEGSLPSSFCTDNERKGIYSLKLEDRFEWVKTLAEGRQEQEWNINSLVAASSISDLLAKQAGPAYGIEVPKWAEFAKLLVDSSVRNVKEYIEMQSVSEKFSFSPQNGKGNNYHLQEEFPDTPAADALADKIDEVKKKIDELKKKAGERFSSFLKLHVEPEKVLNKLGFLALQFSKEGSLTMETLRFSFGNNVVSLKDASPRGFSVYSVNFSTKGGEARFVFDLTDPKGPRLVTMGKKEDVQAFTDKSLFSALLNMEPEGNVLQPLVEYVRENAKR